MSAVGPDEGQAEGQGAAVLSAVPVLSALPLARGCASVAALALATAPPRWLGRLAALAAGPEGDPEGPG